MDTFFFLLLPCQDTRLLAGSFDMPKYRLVVSSNVFFLIYFPYNFVVMYATIVWLK
ncbi:hypothetical protein CLU79DRAFT_762200 [Phycomyces nitens]|nr:hypothetical protein CLU79DRAFT_762200 [Phycomyces nitens]